MSSTRGRWLDDDEPVDAGNVLPGLAGLERPAVARWLDTTVERRIVLPPGPVDRPESEVAQWLDDEQTVVQGDDRAPRFKQADTQTEAHSPVRVDDQPVKAHPTPSWTHVVLGIGGLLYAIGALLAVMGNTNVAGAIVVIPVLVWIAHTIGVRLAALDGQPAIVPILVSGLAMKLIGVFARYAVAQQVYGRSDATEYALWGRQIAAGLRSFEIIDIGKLSGTNFIRFVTGIVFAVTPGTLLTGYVVFGFFAYLGMIFFWRAYRRTISDQNDLRYLQVLMLLPSLAFWPSSIGKDAWMVLGVGIACYGVACVLSNRTLIGWAGVALGSAAITAVRPHVGVPIFVGLLLAELFRQRGSQGAIRALFSLVLIAIIGLAVLRAASSFLGVETFTKATIQQELGSVGDRTSEGRSQFQPIPVNSPVHFPPAALTVLYRPMPFEAHSPQEFGSALENVALIVITMLALKKIARAIRHRRLRPYVLFCIGALSAFVVEYSSFSNFALIARQRTQVMALLLVLVCLPREPAVEVDKPRVRESESAPGRLGPEPE